LGHYDDTNDGWLEPLLNELRPFIGNLEEVHRQAKQNQDVAIESPWLDVLIASWPREGNMTNGVAYCLMSCAAP
jgi:hypothetical protein